uniref:Uncharacterized protein n=1 Tax=Chromera velia CCMP2878 TaxID=1169474 RepID=A0A0G4HHQ8_9ALVE|eukprot:Cvel_1064.t1-p1 / transcript=Cvel_1064.t1 / gene=Cvel_1064 / organism=Chromera_velia_CCMP2878 / gene_product=hypothetical protein / transcript_product=hypothetical protein / location=Cvel_scaffold34:143238-146079(-) / protein_length=414 / sequence_SO=supercontig / SO=protein_coding / is_pseudo=false
MSGPCLAGVLALLAAPEAGRAFVLPHTRQHSHVTLSAKLWETDHDAISREHAMKEMSRKYRSATFGWDASRKQKGKKPELNLDLTKRTHDSLDFGVVEEKLRDCCQTWPGKESIHEENMATNIEDINEWYDEVKEAQRCMETPLFRSDLDYRDFIEHMEAGGSVSIRDLAYFGRMVEDLYDVKSLILRQNEQMWTDLGMPSDEELAQIKQMEKDEEEEDEDEDEEEEDIGETGLMELEEEEEEEEEKAEEEQDESDMFEEAGATRVVVQGEGRRSRRRNTRFKGSDEDELLEEEEEEEEEEMGNGGRFRLEPEEEEEGGGRSVPAVLPLLVHQASEIEIEKQSKVLADFTGSFYEWDGGDAGSGDSAQVDFANVFGKRKTPLLDQTKYPQLAPLRERILSLRRRMLDRAQDIVE